MLKGWLALIASEQSTLIGAIQIEMRGVFLKDLQSRFRPRLVANRLLNYKALLRLNFVN